MNSFIEKLAITLLIFGILLPLEGFCVSLSYQYDSLNRLTKVTYGDGTVISYSYDPAGNRLSRSIVINASVIKGDINGDDQVNLADAILALQVLSGQNPADIRPDYAGSAADVTGNQRIGMEEAVYILQKTAGLR